MITNVFVYYYHIPNPVCRW